MEESIAVHAEVQLNSSLCLPGRMVAACSARCSALSSEAKLMACPSLAEVEDVWSVFDLVKGHAGRNTGTSAGRYVSRSTCKGSSTAEAVMHQLKPQGHSLLLCDCARSCICNAKLLQSQLHGAE